MDVRNCARKMLAKVIASLLQEMGLESISYSTLRILTKILESFLMHLGTSAQSYCELAGRSQPLITDVLLALSNMGINLHGIESYAYRPYRMVFEDPDRIMENKPVNLLQVGRKRKRPAYVPDNLPHMPDPHTYRKTPSVYIPVIDGTKMHIRKMEEKRWTERAIIKLKMKQTSVDTLFLPYQPNLYPLISCTPMSPVYRKALLPCDQSWPTDTDSSNEMDEEIDNPYLYPVRIPSKTDEEVTRNPKGRRKTFSNGTLGTELLSSYKGE